ESRARDSLIRFGIGNDQSVVLQDRNSAGPAEMAPLIHEVHIPVEDLDPVVGSVRDEQSATRIERQRVRAHEFTRAGSQRAVLGLGQWPSATIKSPLGAMTHAVGPRKVSCPAFDTPGLPKVRRSFPFGSNWYS